MALATLRAFAKVKSSAMMARQPSVPNLICAGALGATDCICCAVVIPPRSIREGGGAKRAAWARLQEVFEAALFEPFYDFGDVLRAVAGADQEGIGSFDDDEVAYTDGGDEFRGTPDKISFGFEHVACAGEDVLVCGVGGFFVDVGQGADVAPADVGGNHENAGRGFFASSGFENGVIDGDVFEVRINGAQFAFVFTCADGGGESFESGVSFRQILF